MRTFAHGTMSLLAALALAAVPALAVSAHFVVGPTFTLSDGVINACADIAGLGNVATTIRASCEVDFTCINKGGNPNNAHETVSSQVVLTPHNGRLRNACVVLTPGCPRGQTGPDPATVTFANCTYTVVQNGAPVLEFP